MWFKLIILIALTGTARGQSFFKVVPKPVPSFSFFADTVQLDPVKNEIRPVVEISSYGFPGDILLTGGGFSYQHLKLKKERWKVVYSISYMTWCNLKLVYHGLTFGILNNNILIGIAAHSKEIIGTVGLGINFNN